MAESILVVERSKLSKYIDGKTGLIRAGYTEILKIVQTEHEFMDRDKAELDPMYKQIIPYVVLRRGGSEYFYTRRLNKGGEARLHGKISLGAGGHINPPDDAGDALMSGLRREVNEEFKIERELKLEACGVINDDSNEVGAVHLGFMFIMDVEGEVSVRETEKLEGAWLSGAELEKLKNDMETWSQIVMEAL